jgi:hypothetical protein
VTCQEAPAFIILICEWYIAVRQVIRDYNHKLLYTIFGGFLLEFYSLVSLVKACVWLFEVDPKWFDEYYGSSHRVLLHVCFDTIGAKQSIENRVQ